MPAEVEHRYGCPSCGDVLETIILMASSHCFACDTRMPRLGQHGQEHREGQEDAPTRETLFDPPRAKPVAAPKEPKPKKKIDWGKGGIRRYHCSRCEHTWAALSDVSTCPGCGQQYHPQPDSRKPCKPVRHGKEQPEQMHLSAS